jgi:capsular polysaccharide biosynthesis protein
MAVTDVYAALWRNKLFILGMTLVVGVVAYVLVSTQPNQYRSTALIRIEQRGAATAGDLLGSLEVGQRLAQTYAHIVETESIKLRVATKLKNLVPPTDISLSAAPVSDIELVEVSAESEVPQRAALVANAAVSALQAFVADTGTTSEKIVAIDRARVPDTPSSPRVKLTVAVAVLLGLLFNGSLALLLELHADRLPPLEDMEEAFGAPVLATVPELSFRQSTVRLASSWARANQVKEGTATRQARGRQRAT